MTKSQQNKPKEFKINPQLTTPKPRKHIKDLYALDSLENMGFAQDDSMISYPQEIYGDGIGFYDDLVQDNVFQGYPQLAYYRQTPMVNAIVQSYARNMTRAWIDFYSVSGEDKTDLIFKLKEAFNKFKIKKLMHNIVENVILFGGSLLLVRIKGDENDLAKELILNGASIGANSIEFFKALEPLYCQVGGGWNADDATREDFYNPQSYNIFGKEVHISRLLKFTYIEAPYFLKPMYRFFGIPLIQLCIRDIQRLENMKNSQEDIIARYNLLVLKTNLNALIYGEGNAQGTVARMQALNSFRDNNDAIAVDKTTEDVETITMNSSGVQDNVKQAAEFICMAIQTPATEFMGISPSGFNSTGDSEKRTYYDLVKSNQELILRDNMTEIMHMIMLSEFGYVEPDIDFKFNALWEMSDNEMSQIRLNETNRAVQNVTAGITTQQIERERLAQDPDSGYENIDLSNVVIEPNPAEYSEEEDNGDEVYGE